MGQGFSLISCAKLNLSLKVAGKRSDGHHLIESVFQAIDLHDTIHVEVIPDGRGRVEISHKGFRIPEGKENIVFPAVQAISSFAEARIRGWLPPSLNLFIEKRIPPGGGLGGGSSNAASILLFLSRLLPVRPGPAELMRMGARISADIPFFLRGGGAALVQGVGEIVTPLPHFPALYYILIFPGIPSITKHIYGKFNFYLTYPFFDVTYPHPSGFDMRLFHFVNDLQGVAEREYPAIRLARERLQSLGDHPVSMSGSGSSIFAVFEKREERDGILQRIEGEEGWTILPVKGIDTDSTNNTTGG